MNADSPVISPVVMSNNEQVEEREGSIGKLELNAQSIQTIFLADRCVMMERDRGRKIERIVAEDEMHLSEIRPEGFRLTASTTGRETRHACPTYAQLAAGAVFGTG